MVYLFMIEMVHDWQKIFMYIYDIRECELNLYFVDKQTFERMVTSDAQQP